MVFTVTHEDDEDRGTLYALAPNNDKVGILTYVWADNTHLIADYSSVKPGYENEGTEKMLIEALADFARAKNCKIVPLSSFVKLACKTDKNIQDVVEPVYL
jgi:predicted GNAT family acetyltransferase